MRVGKADCLGLSRVEDDAPSLSPDPNPAQDAVELVNSTMTRQFAPTGNVVSKKKQLALLFAIRTLDTLGDVVDENEK